MGSTLVRRLVQLTPLVVVALVCLGGAAPLVADDAYDIEAAQIQCFQNLRDCYGRAARQDSWVDRWLAGLDCELEFTDCTRRAIIGR